MEFGTVACECPMCAKLTSVTVKVSDYYKWVNGTYVQDAFPYLSVTEREQLVSGMCPTCQSAFYGEADDGDPED